MSVGCQVFNASGQLTFSSTDYIPRFLGSFQTGTAAGSITDGNLTNGTGTPFIIYYPILPPSSYNGGHVSTNSWGNPTVSVSGSTISWSFPNSSVQPNNCLVIYGLR